MLGLNIQKLFFIVFYNVWLYAINFIYGLNTDNFYLYLGAMGTYFIYFLQDFFSLKKLTHESFSLRSFFLAKIFFWSLFLLFPAIILFVFLPLFNFLLGFLFHLSYPFFYQVFESLVFRIFLEIIVFMMLFYLWYKVSYFYYKGVFSAQKESFRVNSKERISLLKTHKYLFLGFFAYTLCLFLIPFDRGYFFILFSVWLAYIIPLISSSFFKHYHYITPEIE